MPFSANRLSAPARAGTAGSAWRIVPLVAEGFQFPPDADLPPEVARLAGLNAVVYSHAYFGASFDRLEEFLRAPPPGGT